jgi:competence protein ComGC
MALLFYEQGLYRQQLNYNNQSVMYAWKGKDTLLALRNYEQDYLVYRGLGVTDSAILIIEDVAQKYTLYGYNVYSAISLGLAIRPLVDEGKFQKAKDYMNIYESQSGRFDSRGNIEVGREIYYKTKGLYFLYTENLDSAEYYFRKELRDGKDFGNQNSAANGLALLYHKIHKPDSAAKYAIYAYTMLDSVYAQRSTKEVERMQALYDYTRHQEIAHQEQKKANQRTIIIWICVGIIIVICLLTFIIIRELTRKKKTAEQKYMQSLSSIEQAQSDIVKLQTNAEINKELISEKEQIIREQETIMKSLLRHDSNSQSLADRKLIDTDIYKRFEQLSTKGQQPTQEEW